MTIRVVVFATLAERLGVRELNIDLTAPVTVKQALDVLQGRHPALAELRDRVATAVNLAYVKPDHILADGDELALIPPVSGG